jgi:hypothetical protein
MSNANGLATAADFRELAIAARWTEPERVTLPKCGLAIVLRRPTKFYWALRRAAWPLGLREKMGLIAEGAKVQLEREEMVRLLREDREMLAEAFVSPKISLAPGPEQFDPAFLPEEDAEFVMKYLRGQVTSSNVDLESFPRGEQGPAADSGATSPDLALPSEPAPKPVGS